MKEEGWAESAVPQMARALRFGSHEDRGRQLIGSTSSPGRKHGYVLWLLWFLVLGAIPLVNRVDPGGWDVEVYRHAMQSVRAGRDPYADSTAVQEAAQRAKGGPSPLGPFNYDYSPITLPTLRFFAGLPLLWAGILYGLLYAAGVAAQNWFGLGLMTEGERRTLGYYAPISIFFPGLLGSDNIMSGNVAYILYGAVLVCIPRALRSGKWGWFYAAVLGASCFKPPMLCLLAVPLLCARRQWLPASVTGVAGLAVFAVQPLLFPESFRNYMKAVRLMFSFNRDFGFSPAGLFSGWRFDHHLPYSPAGTVFYLVYAVPLFAALLYLSRRYLRGEFTTQEWVPVMLTGVVLLNPRLIEYDVAPLALPLALVGWRYFRAEHGVKGTLLRALAVFGSLNLLATHTWTLWKLTEGPLLMAFLLAGIASLLKSAEAERAAVRVQAALTEA
ncbi:MAG TPA: hypothetical protein VII58_06540 [Acidobacteriaceae bacterium]